jgi:hypothetical protein
MFKEVGYAMPVRRFISSTSFDPDTQRNTFHMRHVIGGNCQAVGKTRYFNTHQKNAPIVPFGFPFLFSQKV